MKPHLVTFVILYDLGAQRDGIDFYLASIPSNFNTNSKEFFNLEFMQSLFSVGFEQAKQGYPWITAPPGFKVD